MAYVEIESSSEPQSYSPTVSAALISAALLSPMLQVSPVAANLQRQHVSQYGVGIAIADHSYQDSQVTQVSESEQLMGALQTMYDNLLAEQVDLDPVEKKALYSKLWTLYE